MGAGADEGGEAFDGFEVVIEDVGAGVHDHMKGPVAIVEIRDEDLDDDAGIDAADGGDGVPKMCGSAIAEIIPGDCGDDDVLEIHAGGGLGDAVRFIGLEGIRAGGFHSAESAGAGAFIPGDHEGGGAFAPTFPAVRALGFLADGDEFEIRDEGFRGPEGGVVWQADLDPIGFSLPMESGVHFHFRAAGGHVVGW